MAISVNHHTAGLNAGDSIDIIVFIISLTTLLLSVIRLAFQYYIYIPLNEAGEEKIFPLAQSNSSHRSNKSNQKDPNQNSNHSNNNNNNNNKDLNSNRSNNSSSNRKSSRNSPVISPQHSISRRSYHNNNQIATAAVGGHSQSFTIPWKRVDYHSFSTALIGYEDADTVEPRASGSWFTFTSQGTTINTNRLFQGSTSRVSPWHGRESIRETIKEEVHPPLLDNSGGGGGSGQGSGRDAPLPLLSEDEENGSNRLNSSRSISEKVAIIPSSIPITTLSNQKMRLYQKEGGFITLHRNVGDSLPTLYDFSEDLAKLKEEDDEKKEDNEENDVENPLGIRMTLPTNVFNLKVTSSSSIRIIPNASNSTFLPGIPEIKTPTPNSSSRLILPVNPALPLPSFRHQLDSSSSSSSHRINSNNLPSPSSSLLPTQENNNNNNHYHHNLNNSYPLDYHTLEQVPLTSLSNNDNNNKYDNNNNRTPNEKLALNNTNYFSDHLDPTNNHHTSNRHNKLKTSPPDEIESNLESEENAHYLEIDLPDESYYSNDYLPLNMNGNNKNNTESINNKNSHTNQPSHTFNQFIVSSFSNNPKTSHSVPVIYPPPSIPSIEMDDNSENDNHSTKSIPLD